MLIYFLTTDLAQAEAEAVAQGWVRVAVNRWMTKERNDVRMIRHTREFQILPGGSFIIPAADLYGVDPLVNDQPWEFKKMCAAKVGVAWLPNPLLGEDGSTELLDSILPPPPEPTSLGVLDVADIRETARAAARARK